MTTSILMFLAMVVFFYAPLVYIIILIVKALRKYLKSADVRKEKNETGNNDTQNKNKFYRSKEERAKNAKRLSSKLWLNNSLKQKITRKFPCFKRF